MANHQRICFFDDLRWNGALALRLTTLSLRLLYSLLCLIVFASFFANNFFFSLNVCWDVFRRRQYNERDIFLLSHNLYYVTFRNVFKKLAQQCLRIR